MGAVVGEAMMIVAVGVMLPAMWHLLRAMIAAVRAMRAGHAGRWMLWDQWRFHDVARAPEAARPHLRGMHGHLRRVVVFAGVALLIGIPAAILAG